MPIAIRKNLFVCVETSGNQSINIILDVKKEKLFDVIISFFSRLPSLKSHKFNNKQTKPKKNQTNKRKMWDSSGK